MGRMGSCRVWSKLVRHPYYLCERGPFPRHLFCSDVGWPARAMREVLLSEQGNLNALHHSAYFLELPLTDGRGNPVCVTVPMRILPLGFTLNTLLAAGVLLGVGEGFSFARRRARRAKGRCAACGYDRGGLAGDAACPECGNS
jgi:hypothetical protein